MSNEQTQQSAHLMSLTNKQKYDQAFVSSLSLELNQLGDQVAYNQSPAWDSIGHMALVAALEDSFGISLETDDIMNFSTYKKGFEILAKYGVQF